MLSKSYQFSRLLGATIQLAHGLDCFVFHQLCFGVHHHLEVVVGELSGMMIVLSSQTDLIKHLQSSNECLPVGFIVRIRCAGKLNI